MRYCFYMMFLLFSLTGCANVSGMMEELSEREWSTQLTKPTPWGIGKVPEGSEMFQKGWKDGCETGLGSYGNTRYQMAYDFVQDYELVNNPEYYRAWKDANVYCRWYAYGWVRTWHE